MEGKGKVDGDMQSLLLGMNHGPTRQPVHPMAAALVVVGIIVFSMARGVDAVGRTCPLQPVACRFAETRVAAGLSTGDVTHAATYLYRIGCHDASSFRAPVAQRDAPLLSLLKGEGAQVDPSTSTHPLVHLEGRGSPLMVHGVEGIVSTFRQRTVGHIDGIFPLFRNLGYPFGVTGQPFLDGFNLSVRAHLEGILKAGIAPLLLCKTLTLALAPVLRSLILDIGRLRIE